MSTSPVTATAPRDQRIESEHPMSKEHSNGGGSKMTRKKYEKELEKLTHDHVAEIDRMVQHKEHELLEV